MKIERREIVAAGGLAAFAGAVGLALLFNRFSVRDAAANRRMAGVLAATQVVALAVGALWLALGGSGISPVHAQALAEVGPSANWQLSAAWAVAATVLTLVLAWKWPGSGLLIGLLALLRVVSLDGIEAGLWSAGLGLSAADLYLTRAYQDLRRQSDLV